MSIWNDPAITFEEFAKYCLDRKNKAALQVIWKESTKSKKQMSDIEPHELSHVLVQFMMQCIQSKNKASKPTREQLQDASQLFSDWILENKLSGIPSSDTEDFNQMSVSDIFETQLVLQWISEASAPLQSYIAAKNEHLPSLSQKEITANNKRIVNKHPSLAHLFQQKIVNKAQLDIAGYTQAQQQKQDEAHTRKQQEQHIHQIRASRANLFFNHSEVGYEAKQKARVYKDSKLSNFLMEISAGELLGGKKVNEETQIVELLEPIRGFIRAKYLKPFELDSTQWKFLAHQRSMTTVNMGSQSLTMQINDDLLLPEAEADDDKQGSQSVPFSGAYNKNEDEKKMEDNPASYNDPMKAAKLSHDEQRRRQFEQSVNSILGIKKSKRTAQQVLDLWTAAFNLHDVGVLKKCYAPQVVSQQFVNMELSGRDPVLQCLRQMFEASEDVGLEVTHCILKDGCVILEFRTFGSKRGDSNSKGSPTNSNHGDASSTQQQSNGHANGAATKCGLPQKIINGVGIFEVNNGEIHNQKLFWDQDQQWFADMNVIKMPSTSTLSQFLYKHKLGPVLNLNDGHLDSGSSNGSDANGASQQMVVMGNGVDNDVDVMYEMSDEMNDLLALRGWNLADLQQFEDKSKYKQQSKQKQMAQAVFWLAVSVMFVFVVPKYLRTK